MKPGWLGLGAGWLPLSVGLGAAALLLFDALVLWPAWQERAQLVQALVEKEAGLTRQRQAASAIPALKEKYAAKRQAVLALEAELVPAAADTELIRQVESLSGTEVFVTGFQAGEARPLQIQREAKGSSKAKGQAAEPAPYSQVAYRLEAEGGWDELMPFLTGLESQVSGFRLEGLRLDALKESDWQLSVSGALYRVETPLPE